MLTLGRLYQMLSVGRLSNHPAGGDGLTGTIGEPFRPKVLEHTNEALRTLYGRFRIRTRDILISLNTCITCYHLEPKHAISYVPAEGETPVPEDERYIYDSATKPFTGDIIRVLSVYAESNGTCSHEVPLNDEGSENSVFTPEERMLQVPCPELYGGSLSLIYQARHPELTGDLNQRIDLPDIFWGALQSHIAYNTYAGMNTQGSMARAQELLGFYEASCQEVEALDLAGTSLSPRTTKFCTRGWV